MYQHHQQLHTNVCDLEELHVTIYAILAVHMSGYTLYVTASCMYLL
jgi:hypothetical protein